ncbi:MAG: phage protease [Desulfobulbus sp.]
MWNETTALNSNEINLSANDPPEWVALIPPGEVVGRDGRRWSNSNPLNVIQSFVNAGLYIPVDIEHSTELKAPKGEESPAVGWVVELKDIGGAVWGKIKWNSSGKELLSTRQYRYMSPAIRYDKTNGNIVGLSSVGLTNKPNLNLPALNHFGAETLSDTDRSICAMMGVSEEEYLKASLNSGEQQMASALNATEQKICVLMGVSEGEYLQARLQEQMDGRR